MLVQLKGGHRRTIEQLSASEEQHHLEEASRQAEPDGENEHGPTGEATCRPAQGIA